MIGQLEQAMTFVWEAGVKYGANGIYLLFLGVLWRQNVATQKRCEDRMEALTGKYEALLHDQVEGYTSLLKELEHDTRNPS